MGRRCRWGILGTGKIARIMAAALRDSASGCLTAVASRDPGRAQEFAARFAAPRQYAGYAALIADPEVEIAYIAIPHPGHREWAVAAAEAGKHVLCEKPLAMNAAGAAQIVEAARRNDVFLMEAFAYRSHPQTQRLVEILRDGAIGQARMVDASFGYDAGPRPGNYLLNHSLGGGSILDVGCYPTSMAHLIAATVSGTSPAAGQVVTGAAQLGKATGVDHYAMAVLSFPGGIVARVASAIQANLDSSLRVYGSDGTVTVPSPWLPGRDGRPSTIMIDRPGSPPEQIRIHTDDDLYVRQVEAVSGCVREGQTRHPLMGWDESLANMHTLDRWRDTVGLHYDQDTQACAPAPGL
jgi:predicted dehydrogenase